MNLSRSLARILSASPGKKWGLLHSTYVLHPLTSLNNWNVRLYRISRTAMAGAAENPPVEIPTSKNSPKLLRPTFIPFQPKVSNSVQLVGTVDSDVKLHQLFNGSCASFYITVNENVGKTGVSSTFSVPIILQGDLAEIAACHLKKNDVIYVSGQLTGYDLSSTGNDAKEHIKLVAHSLNFTEEARLQISVPSTHNKEEVSSPVSDSKKISGREFSSSWNELINDPKNWIDYREGKRNGQLSTKYPDFKHKETGKPLWLSSATNWVLSKLQGLEFGGGSGIVKVTKGNTTKTNDKDELWKKLVEDPGKWWDNRLDKRKPTSPDFKHKDDGERLWCSSAPAWVLSKLPPPPAGKNVC